MASSSTVIANLALKHLKIAKEIANLDSEQSPEAQSVRAFYDTVRSEVLRDFPWSFATKFTTLALVATAPTDEWGYSYRYPTDCLTVRRILSGLRSDTKTSRVPYLIAADDSGQLIYTDQASAQIEYTFKNQVEESYPSDFVMAFSLKIAGFIAPSLTGGDPFKLGERAFQLYLQSVSRAAANSANQNQPDLAPESEFITGRD